MADLGHRLAVQAHNDAAQVLVAMLDVEVDLVGDLGALLSLGGLGEEDEDEGDDQADADEESLEIGHDG